MSKSGKSTIIRDLLQYMQNNTHTGIIIAPTIGNTDKYKDFFPQFNNEHNNAKSINEQSF